MFKKLLIVNTVSLALLATPLIAAETSSKTASEAKLLFDARLRIETVDDAAFIEDAKANTFRVRLGYRTAAHDGWSALIEVEHTSHLFGEDFNSTANGNVAYPVVVDPDNTELNQAYIQYAPSEATKFMLGRQTVMVDNQRFFGNVGWRQNEQTFDALNVEHRFNNGLNFRYSYLDRVQRIFGDEHPNQNLARWQLNTHLLSLNHAVGLGTLTGYAHFIDNQTLPLSSHQNIGVRYVAKRDNKDALGWLASAEYAKQSDYANGSNDIVLVSNGGKAVWFSENDEKNGVRPMGRVTRGVRGMKLAPKQQVLSLLIADNDQQTVLVATENGFGKRTVLADFRHSGRGTQGVKAIAVSERNGLVVAAKLVNEDDEIMLITTGGVLIRTRVKEIRELGRATQGVKLINLGEGEKLSGLEKIVETDDELPIEE